VLLVGLVAVAVGQARWKGQLLRQGSRLELGTLLGSELESAVWCSIAQAV
jgi:hypothetical protein